MPSADRRLQPRRKARQVRAELPRERILTAAAHVFTEYGYAAGTTNRIAEQARISIGSLYQYFPNKDAILAQLLIRHIDRGTWAEADRLDLSPGALRETVQALVRDAIDRHGRIRTAQIRDLLSRHPDVRVGDVGTAADLILFTIEMNTHKLMAAPSAVPVDTFATELVDMVTRYLRGDCNRRIPGSGRGTYRAGGPAGLAAGPHQRPSLVILRETQRPELRGTRS
ncbi:TetR/AcrR family transcriptional regulator [Actinoplanes lobatus]|uniref:AcrR family transcriptional regulator n=1 Tax=Actinoplanes lobatus TaxID=113568 RepID=A0A7W7HL54_9ACTN|nr:TetR/AcrR family transcriptional regulator [Actinoplanes lobatus]MBB4752548.1 AcrR family transcriptional regulator [Actinoplanes lobatus]